MHRDKLTPAFKANSPTRKLSARVGSYLSGLLHFLGVLEVGFGLGFGFGFSFGFDFSFGFGGGWLALVARCTRAFATKRQREKNPRAFRSRVSYGLLISGLRSRVIFSLASAVAPPGRILDTVQRQTSLDHFLRMRDLMRVPRFNERHDHASAPRPPNGRTARHLV